MLLWASLRSFMPLQFRVQNPLDDPHDLLRFPLIERVSVGRGEAGLVIVEVLPRGAREVVVQRRATQYSGADADITTRHTEGLLHHLAAQQRAGIDGHDGGATIAETVTCWLADDGQHTVPASMWTSWTPGEYVLIQFGRVSTSSRELQHNRSDNGVVGIHWVFGAAIAQ